jgi:hypothetical protein
VITNSLTVTYWLAAALTLVMIVPAAILGAIVSRRWRTGPALADRDRLEQRVALVITLVVVGLSLRLVLVPLWFLALWSLVPHVPGAMCLAGIHQLDTPWSFVASALKILAPLAYGYWLVINALDRRLSSQPLMRQKLRLLMPIALLAIIEGYLDLRVLGAVEPRSVTCCTSLFDMPTTPIATALATSTSVWMWGFVLLATAVVGMAALVGRCPTLPRRVALGASAAAAPVCLVLAVHTKLSPLLLDAPYHHCVFCVMQMSADVPFAIGLIIGGAWLATAAAMLPAIGVQEAYRGLLTRLLRWSAVTLIGGMAILAVRVAVTWMT